MKRLIFYTILNIIFFAIIYLIIYLYDQNGITIGRISQNIYYIIFLFLSIISILYLFGNNNKQSNFIIYGIIAINLIYILFLFFVGTIGFSKINGIIFILFLIIGFLASYIKNWYGYIAITLAILTDIVLLFLSIIPLYNEGIDKSEFEDKYITNLIIYSDISIDEYKANIQKDSKIYKINNGLYNYDLFTNKQGTQILFKSDNLYTNTYGFIVFAGGEFITLTPQSAINITNENEIEILNGNISYYPQNPTKFKIKGTNNASLENSNNINLINNRYNNKLKTYIKIQMGGNVQLNKTVLKISNITLQILNKLFSNKYENNIKNMQEYTEIFDIDLLNTNYKNQINTKNILQGFENGFNNI